MAAVCINFQSFLDEHETKVLLFEVLAKLGCLLVDCERQQVLAQFKLLIEIKRKAGSRVCKSRFVE